MLECPLFLYEALWYHLVIFFQTLLLGRLAAAHRGTLRALQSLHQHLPDYALHKNGMPRTYTELLFLIRQLSLCCAQLEVAGETGVPSSVLNLLKDVNVRHCISLCFVFVLFGGRRDLR